MFALDYQITRKRFGLVRNQGVNVMIDITRQSEEVFLSFDVSDEALEIAAGKAKEMANYTLAACTGLSVCPG